MKFHREKQLWLAFGFIVDSDGISIHLGHWGFGVEW